MMRNWVGLSFFLAGSSLAGLAQGCGVALALAVDVSGSVDSREYRLQIGGLAEALVDPLVKDALVAEQAAVMLVQWSGSNRQDISVPWRRIKTGEDVDTLATEIDGAARAWRNFSTGIGEAVAFTASEFASVKDCRRRVIDVSGDGFSNEGIAPEYLRDTLEAEGFVVNGLAIESDESRLTQYYRDKVIAGQSAFVLTADDFDDYPDRIRQKLLREVTERISRIDDG